MQPVIASLGAILIGVSGVAINRRRKKERAFTGSPEVLPEQTSTPASAKGREGSYAQDQKLEASTLTQLTCALESVMGISEILSKHRSVQLEVEQQIGELVQAGATIAAGVDSVQAGIADLTASQAASAGQQEVASLLQQLEQEQADHAITRQQLVRLEEQHTKWQDGEAALQQRCIALVAEAEQRAAAYRELQGAHAALQQELSDSRADLAAARASREASAPHGGALPAAAAMGDDQGDVPASQPNSARDAQPTGAAADLHRTASTRLRELQQERDELAAQLANFTARAGLRLSRSGSLADGPGSSSSISNGGGGNTASVPRPWGSGSGSGTPPVTHTGSRGASGGGLEPGASTGSHLADLLEGLQQLHVLTEDMVEAAEQVVSSSLMSTGDLVAAELEEGEAEQTLPEAHSPRLASRLLSARRSKLSTWGSGASATGEWPQLAAAARSSHSSSRLGHPGSIPGMGTPPAGTRGGQGDAWGSGVFQVDAAAAGAGSGSGSLGSSLRWGSGIGASDPGGARGLEGGEEPAPGRQLSPLSAMPWVTGSQGGLVHWGSGMTPEAAAGGSPKRRTGAVEGQGPATGAVAGTRAAGAAAAAGDGGGLAAFEGEVGLQQQLEAALLKMGMLEQQCMALAQQNLELQLFAQQQEERLQASSEIMRRMQALSQTLATIRRAPSSTTLPRASDTAF